jgi:hypothetical protein
MLPRFTESLNGNLNVKSFFYGLSEVFCLKCEPSISSFVEPLNEACDFVDVFSLPKSSNRSGCFLDILRKETRIDVLIPFIEGEDSYNTLNE